MRAIIFTCFYQLLTQVSFAQHNNALIVHEWGTFTARFSEDGTPDKQLHKLAYEPVPGFVYHFDYSKITRKDTTWRKDDFFIYDVSAELDNVTIRMETPVLYFYTNDEIKNASVNVKFHQGSISEYFPKPAVIEDAEHMKKYVSYRAKPQKPYFDLTNYDGRASWYFSILPKNSPVQVTYSDNDVPNVWLAPRKTAANKIINLNNEVENYIFYRGIGGFKNPIIPKFGNDGSLHVQNTCDKIPFLMVYEYNSPSSVNIWGLQSLAKDDTALFCRNNSSINYQGFKNLYFNLFAQALVESGLYADEAYAMLATWEQSYFRTEGIKIFWIVPRSYTDAILPISIIPKPSNMERVMVGRTEIELPHWQCTAETIKPQVQLVSQINGSSIGIKNDGDKLVVGSCLIFNMHNQQVFSDNLILKANDAYFIDISKLAQGMYVVLIPEIGFRGKFVK